MDMELGGWGGGEELGGARMSWGRGNYDQDIFYEKLFSIKT